MWIYRTSHFRVGGERRMSLESIAQMLWGIYKEFSTQIEEKIDPKKTYLVEITGEQIWNIWRKSQWLYEGLKEIGE